MASESDDKALEALAAAELLKEAKRGREREKTLGTEGWKKPTGRPNKLFLGRSVASAMKQTRYQDETRRSKSSKSSQDRRDKKRSRASPEKTHTSKKDIEEAVSRKRRRKDYDVEYGKKLKDTKRKSERR